MGVSTGLGSKQIALAFLLAAILVPAPFLWVAVVFVYVVTFFAYSLPLAVFSLAGTLPESCSGGSAQQCAAPILKTALGLWTGERPFSPVAPRAPNIPGQPTAYILDLGNESARSVRDVIRFISQLLTTDAVHSLASALVIVGLVLFLLWTVSVRPSHLNKLATYLRAVDWRGRTGVVSLRGRRHISYPGFCAISLRYGDRCDLCF